VKLILVKRAVMMNAETVDAVLYSVVLRPNRSVGGKTIRNILCLVAVFLAIPGLAFFAIGAWPVMPFLGLEVVLLYGAFRLNQRAGNALEAINLTENKLTVRRVDHWGKQNSVSFPPYWLQVNFDEPPTGRSLLELRCSGRSLTIGHFLQPQERLELARALRRELNRLTRARHRT
jgi:uncharacterized membrane protein